MLKTIAIRAAGLATALTLLSAPAQAEHDDAAGARPAPSPAQEVAIETTRTEIDAAIAGLDDLAADILRRSAVPGLAIAVVHAGETVYAKGFGVRSRAEGGPVDADTVFLLASLSKPIGATVVAHQVARGVVGWDTPVQTHLPWFRLADPWVSAHVTIGDLYAHRAGLPDHAGDDLEDIGYGRKAILERLHLLTQAAFRDSYAYTNFGLTAAAEAVAAAAGKSWEELSAQAIYRPLGMTATSSRHGDYRARVNRAASHIPGPDGYEVADLRQPDAQSPAGGVSSSANDMARWMTMVLGGGTFDGREIIAPAALAPAVSPQILPSPPHALDARAGQYGFGFNVGVRASGRVVFSHSGAFALGAATAVTLIPGLDLGIVVLTNAPPVGAAEAIAASFADMVEFGEVGRDWFDGYRTRLAPLTAPAGELAGRKAPAGARPAQPLEAYRGTYENAYYGAATITVDDGRLQLAVGPAGIAFAMTPWEGDSFIVEPFNENQPKGSVSKVTFDMADGAASAVRIEHLDAYRDGVFTRVATER
ncbi:serine hydrolase [Nitratireductor sp. StC3]|uniref:serine hydrolase n=1 Tax=Nitratireductor sp. StC3 TaxID=2126741 RepID=UPI000D0CE8A5|nr:serine hydrolase [Nitratireductor sp. StC3]PSM18880.1 serine hydrolase [Nitratireductor sp. StC3]